MNNENMFIEMSLPGAPRIVTTPPGPKSQQILQYQWNNESSQVSYSKGMPMALARGRGATLEDVDGNIYIDMFSGAGVMALGHAHPEILKSSHAQIDRLTHTLDIPSETRMKMVEIMREILPKELSRIFFGGPTGSDAVEQAIKVAKYNTKRNGIIAFEGSYHGMTGVALALTSDNYHREGIGQLVPGVQFIPYPYEYRNPFGCPQDKIQNQAAEFLERVITDPHSGFDLPAAVILEAVQGEGGTIIGAPAFLQKVREITKKHGIVLIIDEVQAGFGRTGKMFAFEHAGIIPDIVVMSKTLGGIGFPISAIAYREELNTLPTGKSIGTFRGNMVAFAAGATALNWMVEHKIPERASVLGKKGLELLKSIESKYDIVGEARGIGLMLALEMVTDKNSKTPSETLARAVRKYVHQRGVMVEVGGHYNNVVRLLPPLVIPENYLIRGIEVIEGVVAELEAGALEY